MTALKSDFFSRVSSLSTDPNDTDDVRFRRILRIHLASFIQLQRDKRQEKEAPGVRTVSHYLHYLIIIPLSLQSPYSRRTLISGLVIVVRDKGQYQAQSSEKSQ